MSDLNSKHNELIVEIFNNFIFFIPKTIFENDIFIDIEINGDLGIYLDKIILIDSNSNLIIAPNELKIEDFIIKRNKLTKNCFKVIELKNSENIDAFKFFCDKYLEQLRFYKKCSDLLVQYFETNSPIKDSITKSIFLIQNQSLCSHLTDIEKSIDFKPIASTQTEIINDILNSEILKKYTSKKENFNKNNTEIKPFKDFIRRGNKDEIETKIKTHFSNLKGVSLRYLIQYLEDEAVLILNHGDYQKIYDSLKKLFGGKDIAHYNSIFSIPNFSNKDKNYLLKRKSFELVFEKMINNQ